jgi:hypothetical protein
LAGVRVNSAKGVDQVGGVDDDVVTRFEGLDFAGHIHVGVEGGDDAQNIDLACLAASDDVATGRGGLAEFLLEPTGSRSLSVGSSYIGEGVASSISVASNLAILVGLGSLSIGVCAYVGVVARVDVVKALRARLLRSRGDVIVRNFARCECRSVGRVDISIATRD